MISEGTLTAYMRSSLNTDLPDGWLYLPTGDLLETTVCLYISSDDADQDEGVTLSRAAELGFPIEGLDTQTMQDVAICAIQLDPNASDALLVRAFQYYHRFDAFLPSVSASDPPPYELARLKMDRDFYDSLGEESLERGCRREGCDRGAVYLSSFCRMHHFENVWRRPSPFD